MMTLKQAGFIAKEITKAAISATVGSVVGINLGKSNPLDLDDTPNVIVSSLIGWKVYDETSKCLDAAEFLITEGGEKIRNKIAAKKAAKEEKEEDEYE